MSVRGGSVVFFCTIILAILGTGLIAQEQEADDPHQAFLKSLKPIEKQTATPDLNETAEQILSLTNKFRASEKKSKLVISESLKTAAQKFAQYMADNSKYGHEADGRNFLDRAKEAGYMPCLALENIAFTYSTQAYSVKSLSETLMDGWKKSPGHRENLLDADVTETGIGVARNATTGVYYAVHLFGRPLSAMREFQVKNETTSEVTYSVGEQTFTLLPKIVRSHKYCRSPKVTFAFVADNDPKKTVSPAENDKFIVQMVDGEVTVKQELTTE
jgi:uncharacterized protein YkwD